MTYRGLLKEYSSALNAAFHVADWLMIAVSAWLAHWLYLGSPHLPGRYLSAVGVVLLLAAWLFPRFSLYQAWRGVSVLDEIRSVVVAWGAVLLALMVFVFVTKSGTTYSRGWLGIWFGLSAIMLVSARILLRAGLRWLRRQGFNQRHIVIVGNAGLGNQVAERIAAAPWMGLQVVGFFHGDDTAEEAMIPHAPHLGGLEALADYVSHEGIDQVWIAMPLRNEEGVRRVLHELRHSTVDVRFVLDFFGMRLLNHSVMDVAGLPVVNLSVTPMSGLNQLLKAVEDWGLSLLIFLLMSPLLLLIAVAVKLSSPGPVLFRQVRYGWDGKSIEVYKFRSMVVHEEADGQVTQAKPDDERFTPIGRFLRRTSLDELPQFYNVLQGRMSIVGPRPHAVAHNEHYKDLIDGYMKRHKVKPGITGWAQINGWRGETDTLEKMQKRVELDLYYIEHWSLGFDLKIIFLTIFRGWSGRSAY